MNIVKAERKAKTKKWSELLRGEFFIDAICEGEVQLRTDIDFREEGWAVTVISDDKEVGASWKGKRITDDTATLCNADGEVEYEDAGERVAFGELLPWDIFLIDSRSDSTCFIIMPMHGDEVMIIDGMGPSSPVSHDLYKDTLVTRYPNATLHLNGKDE